MRSVESARALLGLDAAPLVLLDFHSHSWMDAPWCQNVLRDNCRFTFRVATCCSYDFV